MTSSLRFGDIFLHNECEYIFLTATSDQIYASKILDKYLTRDIDNSCKNEIRKNRDISNKPLYCYIILTTEEVKDRLALFANTDGYSFDKDSQKLSYKLNETDKKSILNEISQSHSLPIKLKELMNQKLI